MHPVEIFADLRNAGTAPAAAGLSVAPQMGRISGGAKRLHGVKEGSG
jgi:hypothetical protein